MIVFLLLLIAPVIGAQEVVSAEKFLQSVSDAFGKIKDLEATISWTQGKSGTWTGNLSYKNPVYLRIDFTSPRGQVLAMDAEQLTIYVPSYDVVMTQKFKRRSEGQLLDLMSAKGLSTLQRNFSVSYLSGPSMVPLEDGSREQVWKLKLTPTTASTGYKSMVISITKDYLYRRIEGTRTDGESDSLDFTGVRVNQNLPDARFRYDPPPTANVIPDMLFDAQE